MSEPQASPISQMLLSLGLTREDLMKETDSMRSFLNTENAAIPRVAEAINALMPPSVAENRITAKPPSTTSSFTRSRSRASSNAFRETSPPMTPVKSEPVEGGIPVPLRSFGSMEEVIERQRRQSRREKKERRERERESQAKLKGPRVPSPSPSNAPQSGFTLDSRTKPRVETPFTTDSIQVSADRTYSQSDNTCVMPVTPQRNKYYREHTNLSSSTHPQPLRQQTPVKTESPSTTPTMQPPPTSQSQYLAYPQYLAYARLLPPLGFPNLQAGPSMPPVTPQNRRTYTLHTKLESSPLPPSSPPPPSSPVSTPNRPPVNLVSSPGPMGPLPEKEEYDKLPYTLPPGPYSPHKPDLSYAALVGQAILSSPQHRLTLQEIYDWITIVYPHFKRGETTWMNSIRHVLSTTICFRKVPRDRSVGRTLWAIWDEDLECFKGGGFRKHLCKDIAQSLAAKAEQSKGKGKGRKRAETDDGADQRKPKRVKREQGIPAVSLTTSYMPATLTAHPLFPPTRPTTHHQPYYESCMQPQTLPAEVIFPPLPAGVGYNRLISTVSKVEPRSKAAEGNSEESERKEVNGDEASEVTPSPESTPIVASDSAPSSLPDLTPNCSSSSPPPESSDLGTSSSSIEDVNLDDYITIGGDSDNEEEETPAKDEDDNVFIQSLLSPAKDLVQPPKSAEKSKAQDFTLGSGFKLELGAVNSSDDDDQALWMRTKGITRSPDGKRLSKKMSFPPIPTSPTLNRKASCHLGKVPKPLPSKKLLDAERPSTPTPSTPPRTASQLPVSSVRTPLSSKGVNPAALHSEWDDDAGELELSRTPRKRVVSSGAHGGAPVTPRRLVFPTNQNESPFSTPAGGGIFSPFRTPGSRSVFDPHDPGALLDEELNRMGAATGDSPAGLFGKGRGTLLYESPGFSSSPGQYARWW